ncbi:MAG TPA: hypothetical protein VHY08_19110 [Bacillota bacterium]|nr:hypothetical protein [Bacillota bacterium]
MIWLLVLLAVPIFICEGLPLIREKRWKELITAGALLSVALLIGLIKTFGAPTPIQLLDQWIRPVGEAIFKHF